MTRFGGWRGAWRDGRGGASSQPALPAPAVTSVSPDKGSQSGSTAVTVNGTEFQNGATVTFGGASATGVNFVSSTQLTCTTPAGSIGATNVVVTNPDTQTSGATGNGRFTYLLDPTTLNLTGYWRADYPGAPPWTGTASVGISGNEDLEAGPLGSPGAGATQNGFTPADFNGVDDSLISEAASPLSTFVTVGLWTGWTLFVADAATADPGVGLRRNVPPFWDDNAVTVLQVNYHTGGVTLNQVGTAGGGTLYEVTQAAGTGAYHLAVYGYDGTNIWISVDGAAVTTVAATDVYAVANRLRMAVNYLNLFFNGRILEQAMSKQNYQGQIANLEAYVNNRYGLSL